MMHKPFVRPVLILFIAFKVFDDLFATALTLAYRLRASDVAEGFSGLTVGDDYTRLIPLMEAVPLWLHGFWVLAAALYMTAIVLLMRDSQFAFIPALFALIAELIAKQAGQPIIDAAGVAANPNPSFVAAIVIPFLLPLFLAGALWKAGGRSPTPLQQP